MNSQATIAELAVMLMLGAIIAMPIESADRGIVPGMLLLFVVLFLQRASAMFALSRGKLPRVIASQVSALVIDGEMQLLALAKERISQEQLFSILRQREICSLGEIERLYFESNGGFSIFKSEQKKAGLCIFPNTDRDTMFKSRLLTDTKACSLCGATAKNDSVACVKCDAKTWTGAIL